MLKPVRSPPSDDQLDLTRIYKDLPDTRDLRLWPQVNRRGELRQGTCEFNTRLTSGIFRGAFGFAV